MSTFDAQPCTSYRGELIRSAEQGLRHSVGGMPEAYLTCVVFMLGYPGMGKRTVGGRLVGLLGGVLVDNQLINRPLLELVQWDGKTMLPPEIWKRAEPIREAVLGTIEDIAPSSASYVFTNVLEDDPPGAQQFDRVRSLAVRRGSLFLSVMLTCDIDVQLSRIDTPDRIALRKGSEPEQYRSHRVNTVLFQPPASEMISVDTTTTDPEENAEKIYMELVDRGLRRASHSG